MKKRLSKKGKAERAVFRLHLFMQKGDMNMAHKQAAAMWYRTGWDDGYEAGRRSTKSEGVEHE